jgi:AraC-like DNA-binding protein
MRQSLVPYLLRTDALTFSDGHEIESHAHSWGQLLYAATGTMRVLAADALWLVTQGRALWAPPNVTHEIVMRGGVAMRTIYVPPGRARSLPPSCQAIEVKPLLRELILHIVPIRLLRDDDAEHRRLAALFLDQLARAERAVLHVPMPRDPALAAVVARVRDDPARNEGLPALARRARTSARTIQRRFLEETGMRFVEWRQRLKLMHAMTKLGAGASVTEAGAEAGYANTSAFIAAFRAYMGETPRAFLKRGG